MGIYALNVHTFIVTLMSMIMEEWIMVSLLKMFESSQPHGFPTKTRLGHNDQDDVTIYYIERAKVQQNPDHFLSAPMLTNGIVNIRREATCTSLHKYVQDTNDPLPRKSKK